MINEDYWSDERVYDKIKKLGLTNREAFAFTNINPENYEVLKGKDADLEKKWIYLTSEMFNYYSLTQIHLWFEEVIAITSEQYYNKNKNFEKLLNRINPQQKKFYKYFKDSGLNFEQVLQHYNIKLTKDRTLCPFHNGENNTSFQIDFNKQKFKCWSCGVYGDCFKFIELMEDKKNGNF